MNYHTAVVVVICSLITLVAWIAWLWRPYRTPGWMRKLQGEQERERRKQPTWQSRSETTRRETTTANGQTTEQDGKTETMPPVKPRG